MKNKYQIKGLKIYVVISIFLFFGSITCFAQALGDVNNNGDIDIVDALLIAQYYVGLDPIGFVSSAADVNCSCAIDIVKEWTYFGRGSMFPSRVRTTGSISGILVFTLIAFMTSP